MRSASFVLLLALCLALAACASGSGESGTAAAPPASHDQPAASSPAAPSMAAEPPSGGDGQDGSSIDWATIDLTTIDWASIDLSTVDWSTIEDNPTAANLTDEDQALILSRLNPGSATVTLGEEASEGDSFLCASGHENTESDVYSFSSYTEAVIDGLVVRVGFEVRDPSGTGQTTGDGVVYEMQIRHVNDMNPEISWTMTAADSVSIDGTSVSVSGSFDDLLTEGLVEDVPGSLEAECGDTSRF